MEARLIPNRFANRISSRRTRNRFEAERTARPEDGPGGYRQGISVWKGVEMKKRKVIAGERMIESAKQALAFATGKKDHGCEVHVPDNIDVKAIREKISLSQGEFAKLFGLSKRTLEHWEHGRRVPSGAARAFLTVIAREPDAVRRALLAERKAEGDGPMVCSFENPHLYRRSWPGGTRPALDVHPGFLKATESNVSVASLVSRFRIDNAVNPRPYGTGLSGRA